MTPIDGRRNPKGEQWGKKIPKLNQRRGCLTVFIPVGPRRNAETAARAASSPVPARAASAVTR